MFPNNLENNIDPKPIDNSDFNQEDPELDNPESLQKILLEEEVIEPEEGDEESPTKLNTEFDDEGYPVDPEDDGSDF